MDPDQDTSPQVCEEPHPGPSATQTALTTAGATRTGFGMSSAANATSAVEAATGADATFMQTVAQTQNAAQASGGITPGNVLAPIALASGVAQDYSAIQDMNREGATPENTANLVQGTLGATSGAIGTTGLAGGLMTAGGLEGGAALTAGAAAAAPVALVAGAGAAGMGVGHLMANAADSDYTRTGFWGTDPDTHQNRSAMDAAAAWGTDYDREQGNTGPSFGGGVRAAVGGIGAGIAGSAQALYNWL